MAIRCGFSALGLLVFAWPSSAAATWSIVAVDPQTQEVGVALASCVEAPFGTTLLPEVAGLAPGTGALAAQALFNQQNRDQALALLTAGMAPQEIIDILVAGDGQSASRQYGVVTLDLELAAFTGGSNQRWAGDLQGPGVTVQGNILVGPEVVEDARVAFMAEGPRCPWTLADRLLIALEAGAAQGGDSRCSEEQSALAAALLVAQPGDDPDAPTIDLRIPSQPQGGDNPVQLLRASYDEWRAANPPDDAGCLGETSTGPADTSGGPEGSETSAAGTTSDPSPTPPPPSPPDSKTSSSGEDTDGSAPASSETAGCGCRASEPTWGRGLALILLGWLGRRINSRAAER